MARRISALFLLSFLLFSFVGVSLIFAADKEVVRPTWNGPKVAPAAMKYFSSGKEPLTGQVPTPPNYDKIDLNAKATRDYNSNVVGYTYYDYQTNAVMSRHVAHRGTNRIHFDWMSLDVMDGANEGRNCRYNAYDLTTCTFLAGSGTDVAGTRSGYVSLDVYYPTHWPIPAAHQTDPPGLPGTIPVAFYDFAWEAGEPAPIFVFSSDYPTDVYGYGFTGREGIGPGNENIWPKIEMQIGSETVLHMVASESTPTGETRDGMATISYYRRVGDYGFSDGTTNGVWSDQRIIDSSNITGPNVFADPNSDKVAIAWMAPCAFNRGPNEADAWDNDVYYAISTTQGADWAAASPGPSISQEVIAGNFTGGNCSNYSEPATPADYSGAEFGYCEVNGIFDQFSNLHVIWGTRIYTDTNYVTWRDGAIFHWSENHPTPRLVYRAPVFWTNPEAYCVSIPDFMQGVGKMTITECSSGDMYIVFTGFGLMGDTCNNYDLITPPDHGSGNAVGYLYTVASDDGGQNWDAPQRITDRLVTTEGCYPDTTDETLQCHSEMWGSLARQTRTETCGDSAGVEVLDILYVDDLAPGGAIRGDNPTWTYDPITWQTAGCRPIVYVAEWSDNAGSGFGECYSTEPLWVDPDGDTVITFTAYNVGLLPNTFGVELDPPTSSDWLAVSPMSGTIGCCSEDTVTFTLTFSAPAGAADPSSYDGSIVITHLATSSPRTIPACLVVASSRVIPEAAILATACKRIQVYNTGELGNNESHGALDYIDECDTFSAQTDPSIYLYDGSPIVCRIDGTDTLRHSMYSMSFVQPGALRPIASLVVDSESYDDYTYATGEFCTGDSAVGFLVDYFVPKAADTCEFIIERLRFFNRSGSNLDGVLIGEFIDWDIPSDTGSENGSDFDLTRNMIYQYGVEYDTTGHASCGQLETDRYGAIAVLEPKGIKNAMTLDNATWVYTSGPFGVDAPLPAAPTYELMKTSEGFSKWSSPDTTYTDLSTMVTFGEYSINTTDTTEIVKVLITVRDGLSSLEAAYDKAVQWATDRELYSPSCCLVAGDANDDAATNVGDAVYLINYAFKGGPAPNCMDAGDANEDCAVNVGDAVFLINYAFKGGPAPNCGCVSTGIPPM